MPCVSYLGNKGMSQDVVATKTYSNNSDSSSQPNTFVKCIDLGEIKEAVTHASICSMKYVKVGGVF